MTRTVADAAEILQVIAGTTPNGFTSVNVPFRITWRLLAVRNP
jgi:hypothetical protein